MYTQITLHRYTAGSCKGVTSVKKCGVCVCRFKTGCGYACMCNMLLGWFSFTAGCARVFVSERNRDMRYGKDGMASEEANLGVEARNEAAQS